MNLLALFVILNIINVIVATARQLITQKCGKWLSAFINAIYYSFYTVVIIYTVCDLPLLEKCIIVALCNLVGVWIVKFIEEKIKKDKLWKIEVTCNKEDWHSMKEDAKTIEIPFNYINIEKYYLFNFYCATQEESKKIKKLLKNYDVKYFINECKSSIL